MRRRISRKIVQVSNTLGFGPSGDFAHRLVALCDDGTLWGLNAENRDPSWYRLPPVPGPDDE